MGMSTFTPIGGTSPASGSESNQVWWKGGNGLLYIPAGTWVSPAFLNMIYQAAGQNPFSTFANQMTILSNITAQGTYSFWAPRGALLLFFPFVSGSISNLNAAVIDEDGL